MLRTPPRKVSLLQPQGWGKVAAKISCVCPAHAHAQSALAMESTAHLHADCKVPVMSCEIDSLAKIACGITDFPVAHSIIIQHCIRTRLLLHW